MRTIDIIKKGKTIQSIRLFSQFGSYDYTKYQIKIKEIKY